MEFPHCTVCQAPISLRASTCAVCEAPAPPVKKSVPSGEIRSGEWVRFHRPHDGLQLLYDDVVKALLPNIRVLGMVGEGGMALVFVGRDSALKREVAVKVLSPTLGDDAVARKRFTREAESIAAVSHSNIVNVYQVGEIPGHGLPYFVMQFVDGPTLGMGALRGKMLTEARVRRLMADVAAGLAAAHRKKVYHRDIKPNNIVLDGETGRAMVLDFGISAASSGSRRKSMGARLTEEGMYLGTPTYMSPEQGNGEEVTGQSDVYSLGVLAFELLVGRPPFDGSPIAVMASHMRDIPPRVDELRADVSEEFASLIARCLEKAPDRRPTAQEIVHVLDPAEKKSVEWPPPGMARVRSSGARLLTAATGASVATALFFGVVVVRPEFAHMETGAESSVWNSIALGFGFAMVFGMVAMFFVTALVAAQQRRWAVSAGYPTWVVSDVLWDARRDAGNLVNGTGVYTLVPGPVRSRLLTIRRIRAWLLVIAAGVAIVGIGHWAFEWIALGGSGAPPRVATQWALPLLVLYACYFLLDLPERRVRRRERARTPGRTSGENTPPLRGELVKMWMASAERTRKSLSGDEER